MGEVKRWFGARTGLELERMGPDHVRQAIEGAMRDAGCHDEAAFVARLQREPSLFDDLANRLTVGETYFFRDAWHYALIAEQVLPKVAARQAAGGPGLRAWSAGCASGEEIYSLAILLADEGMLPTAQLWATDLSAQALALSGRGRYREWSLRAEEAKRARRHMRDVGGVYDLDARIKDAVRFSRLNLASDPPPAAELDVILCRNVLIYFAQDAVPEVVERLAGALVDGGWLLTGPSDPPLHAVGGLEAIVTQQGVVYQRRSTPAPPPRPRSRRSDAPGPRKALPPEPEPEITGVRRLADLDPLGALTEIERIEARGDADEDHRIMHATLLVALDRHEEAEAVLDRTLASSPRAAIAHFMRASLRLRAGDLEGARLGYERARVEAERLSPDSPLPHTDGEPAGRLAEAAARHLETLSRLEIA